MEGARMNTRYMFRHNTGTEQGASRKRVGPAEQERASGLKLQKSLCTHRQLTSLQKVIQLQHKQKKKSLFFLGNLKRNCWKGIFLMKEPMQKVWPNCHILKEVHTVVVSSRTRLVIQSLHAYVFPTFPSKSK